MVQSAIYSATTFLEKCRKVVLEKWFFKLGFFFLVNHFSWTRKNVDLWYKTTFFSVQPLFSNQISQTRFLKPYFSNQISKNCQNRGSRIKGWVWISWYVDTFGESKIECWYSFKEFVKSTFCYFWSPNENFHIYSLFLERKSQHKSPWQICKFPIWPFRSEKKMLLLFFSGTHWKESESFHYIGVGFFSIHNEMKKFLKKQSQFFPQNIFLPQQHLNPFVFQAASDCAIYW